MAEFKHVTVLLKEAVAGLNVQPTGTYVDATLGGGGHTQAISGSFPKTTWTVRSRACSRKKFFPSPPFPA